MGSVAILHAIASGSRFGFDIMDATGLTSGTVYPALDRLESLGLVESEWEDEHDAHRNGRPARRYFALTAPGELALAEGAAPLQEPAADRRTRAVAPAPRKA